MNEAQKEWFRQRTAAVHERIGAYEVLRLHGVSLQQSDEEREEQFSCPFHGADRKPSARIYPTREGSPSHVWCFVCQETGWDAIGLWRKFNNLSFGQALRRLERELGLETPEAPGDEWEAPKVDTDKQRFEKTYVVCEARLRACKSAYRQQGDLDGYLMVGSILDRTRSRVESTLWKPAYGTRILQALLDRIREKASSCPGD